MKSVVGGIVVLALVSAACGTKGSPDGGGTTVNPNCAPLLQNLQAVLDSTQVCKQDSDCINQTIPCGFVDQCFASVNVDGGDEIEGLVASLQQDNCAAPESSCSCTLPDHQGFCIGGVCGSTIPDGGLGDGGLCSTFEAQIEAVLADQQPCTVASDCVVAEPPCIAGECGEPVAVTMASNRTITNLAALLADGGCFDAECSCESGGAVFCNIEGDAGFCDMDGGFDGGF